MPQRRSASDYINKKKYCAYACVDPKNLVGPQGPQGPQGPTGPEGPEGPPGPPPGPSNNVLQYSINLDIRAVGNEFCFVGVNDSVATAASGNYPTDFSVYNNHVYLNIIAASVTGPSPEVTITGTSISESTAVPVPGDSETITLRPTVVGGYQTAKKWYLVTDISFTDTNPSNYDISILGYLDFLNTDVKITGYRLEVLGDDNSTNTDITFQIIKVNDGTNVQLEDLENITVDGNGGNFGTGAIIDTLRSTRDYSMQAGTRLWPPDTDFVLKQTDFDTYFTADENHILGSTGEGILIKITSSVAFDFSTAPRYAALYVFYENLP